jgi:hypothetical protein
MYKMICIDLDGTLLGSDHGISHENIHAVRQAKEKGVLVVLSTGRMHLSARLYAEQLGIHDPIISSNGSFVKEREGDRVFYERNLLKEDLKFIIDTLGTFGVSPNFYNHGTMYVKEVRDFVLRYEELQKTLPKEKSILIRYINDGYSYEDFMDRDGAGVQKGICFPPDQLVEEIKTRMRLNTDLKVVSSVSSGIKNIEFTSKEADKGRAALVLADAYGIRPEEIICVGDSENDLSMLEVAGLPVAMGNAIDEVKAAARYITKDNDSHGVAHLIEKFILRGEMI